MTSQPQPQAQTKKLSYWHQRNNLFNKWNLTNSVRVICNLNTCHQMTIQIFQRNDNYSEMEESGKDDIDDYFMWRYITFKEAMPYFEKEDKGQVWTRYAYP